MTSSNAQKDKRICIGKIAGTHGVKGLVKIFPYCEDISLLNGTLFTDESGSDTLDITLKNPVGKYILAEIKGVDNKEDAQALKYSLFVPREILPEIDDEDAFYIEDLKGLNVLNIENETIGKVIAVQNFGAGDLLEIKPKSGQSYFIPFQDEYIIQINLDENSITLENTERFIIES